MKCFQREIYCVVYPITQQKKHIVEYRLMCTLETGFIRGIFHSQYIELFLFFSFFFYRSSSAFLWLVFHSDPARRLGHLLFRGPSQSPIFVSGSSGNRTHILGDLMRTSYHSLYLDPQYGYEKLSGSRSESPEESSMKKNHDSDMPD